MLVGSGSGSWTTESRFLPCVLSAVSRADDVSLPDSWKGQFDRVVSIEMLEAVG